MDKKCLNNLIPFQNRTKEELKEISKKGGIASGVARREARTFRETFGNILDIQLSKMLKKISKDQLKRILKEKNNDKDKVDECIARAIVINALQGDVKSFETIRDTMGQKPTDTIEIQTIDNEAYNKVDNWVKSRLKQGQAEKIVEDDTN